MPVDEETTERFGLIFDLVLSTIQTIHSNHTSGLDHITSVQTCGLVYRNIHHQIKNDDQDTATTINPHENPPENHPFPSTSFNPPKRLAR